MVALSNRIEPASSLDFYPTPPWATRALFEHVLSLPYSATVREPACGNGLMSRVISEYCHNVESSDIFDYGYGQVIDYLETPMNAVDWVITNPPYNLAEDFIVKALSEANCGVAMLLRSAFTETIGRYNRLFSKTPPTKMAQFAERVAMSPGEYNPKAGSAVPYCWLIWEQGKDRSELVWIPPCKANLFKESDVN